MGDILPFVARVRDSGDWTPAERARLEALADQFTKAGVHVEVIYGATDDGDPWCVVKDSNEDVLVHVARIGAKFVVHFAAQDTLEEGVDLPSALGARLDDLPDVPQANGGGDVVPFSLAGRQAQSFLALIVATAFFYETREALAAQDAPHDAAAPSDASDLAALAVAPMASEPTERGLPAHSLALADPAPQPAAAAQTSTSADETPAPALKAAASKDEPPAASARPHPETEVAAAPAAAPLTIAHAEGPQTLTGSSGNDHLVGGSGADLIQGGAGDDTLQGGGAGHGQLDTLDGGAGDDRIEVTAQVVATGGEGADTFVIHAPVMFGHAGTLLGTITDFDAAHGDRLVDFRGLQIAVVPGPPNLPAGFGPNARPGAPDAGTQVYLDFNHDGHADGFVLMTHGPPGAHAPAEPEPAGHDVEGPTFVTGASLNTHFEPI